MKHFTRIDAFANMDAVFKFWEWAAKQPPEKKTRADMVRLLEQYKKADLIVEGHKEEVEHKLHEGLKAAAKKKGEKK